MKQILKLIGFLLLLFSIPTLGLPGRTQLLIRKSVSVFQPQPATGSYVPACPVQNCTCLPISVASPGVITTQCFSHSGHSVLAEVDVTVSANPANLDKGALQCPREMTVDSTLYEPNGAMIGYTCR